MSPEVHQSNVVCPGGTGPGAEGGSGWGCPGGGGARARPWSPQNRIPRGRGSPRPGGLLLPPYSVPHSWLIVTSDGGGWQGWCRLVTAAYNYFHVTNFFWMFGEGCYLHTAIVLTYSTDRLRKWMFICIGWGVPFPIIVAWAIGKLYYDNEKCWFGKRPGVYTDYIYQGPMILVLLINFIFLFNIVRILMTKLRASTTSETIQYRKAVKATLVLLPLLGITYMLFFVNPGEDEVSRVVFIYFNSFLESFQGFFVSVFYCFLNSEVRTWGPGSGQQEACWDPRLPAASSCPPHAGSLLPAPRSLRGCCWEPGRVPATRPHSSCSGQPASLLS
uniref:Corticotropin releasing hormone receptor 1 n=1 Tax=Sus scrofa TaxID=9823 RepID=A0A8D1N5V8_PIG